ncbi:hypothetical protein EJB05_10245, partial [Eragrostis curvula]
CLPNFLQNKGKAELPPSIPFRRKTEVDSSFSAGVPIATAISTKYKLPPHLKNLQAPLSQTLTGPSETKYLAAEVMNSKKSSSSVAVASGVKREQVHAGDGNQLQGSDLNCLELRLGISSDNGSSSPWGVDPWSLAARQEKASLEQGHQRPDECDLQRETRPESPVGWPPVSAFRKNQLPSTTTTTKPAAEEKQRGSDGGGDRRLPATASSMFVKVNMEGCAVGRKVDLQAHQGYASLSLALQTMFSQAFLHDAPQWGMIADGEDDEQLETTKAKTYILLYEDNEGDRMLVGDVPWDMFVASAKRLYIAQDPRTRATS